MRDETGVLFLSSDDREKLINLMALWLRALGLESMDRSPFESMQSLGPFQVIEQSRGYSRSRSSLFSICKPRRLDGSLKDAKEEARPSMMINLKILLRCWCVQSSSRWEAMYKACQFIPPNSKVMAALHERI